MLIWIALIISSVVAIDYPSCPSIRRRWCESTVTYLCEESYQFHWDSETAEVLYPPKRCVISGTGCTGGTETCMPDCDGPNNVSPVDKYQKTGGPSGQVCADFNAVTCPKYYADRDGDRWCYWTGTACLEYSVKCHD